MTAARLLVRPVRADETAQLGQLIAEAYQRDGYADDGYLDVLADVTGRTRSATVLVAVNGDDLLGGVTLAAAGTSYAELARPGEQEIRMLAVAPFARGRGAGRALVQACLDQARAQGAAAVVLCSQPQMTPAHRIYADLGFVRVPAMDWSPAPGIDLQGYRVELRE